MGVINTVDLRRVDLNLLVVFQVLIQERHVTRAAMKLNLSQSAVSASLARLRLLFDDQLFLRTREGMVPTPKALSLCDRIAPTLSSIGDVIFDDIAFDPHQTTRTFHLAMSDDVEIVLAPWLTNEKIENGWTVDFAIHQSNSSLWRDSLADPRIDTVLSLTQQQQAASFQSESLFSGGYLCLFDPAQTGFTSLTKAEYLNTSHVRVSFDLQRGWVDDLMAAVGHKRKTLVTISHFGGLATLLQRVPGVATIPEYAARAIASSANLQTCEVPIEPPRFSISAIWSTRVDGSPENAWLRGLLKRFAATL